MNREPHQIVKCPILTEESTLQAENSNRYTFRVEPKANKQQISDAIERLFNVRVVSVNTMNYRGKVRRRGRHTGHRAAWKKAIVALREGDSIDLI